MKKAMEDWVQMQILASKYWAEISRRPSRYDSPFYSGSIASLIVTHKCECGSDKTYGPETAEAAGLHSIWCPANKSFDRGK